jgi:putative heme-binding domain-containing protein
VEDLFTAIVFPSKDIAPAYVPEVFQMKDNESITGFVAFESADGVILRTGPGQTIRLATSEFTSRQPGKVSLMPTGLLQGLKPDDWADLHAYLQEL